MCVGMWRAEPHHECWQGKGGDRAFHGQPRHGAVLQVLSLLASGLEEQNGNSDAQSTGTRQLVPKLLPVPWAEGLAGDPSPRQAAVGLRLDSKCRALRLGKGNREGKSQDPPFATDPPHLGAKRGGEGDGGR